MAKLDKKKSSETSEKGINRSDTTDVENESYKDVDDKNETSSSISHTSSHKRINSAGSNKKRKSTGSTKISTDSESDDSDNLPLNGGKSASICGATPKKQQKVAMTKTGIAKSNISGALNKRLLNNEKKKVNVHEYEELVAEKGADNVSEKEFEVEALVGQKIVQGASYFCVRWKGYGKDDDSWELEEDLNCDDLIKEYRKYCISHKTKANQKGKSAGHAGKITSAETRRPALSKRKSVVCDPNKEWAVERIVDFVEDEEQGGLYRIRWKGFSAKDDTWEPENHLSCYGLIEKFKKGLTQQCNVDTKHLRESPKKTKRLINETTPRSSLHNRIERSSKRAAAKNRVFYGEE